MKASSYNIFVNNADSVIAVNLLSRTSMTWSKEAYNKFKFWASGKLEIQSESERSFAEGLLQNLYLIPNHLNEIDLIKERSLAARYDNEQLGLVITPTMGCNFSCHYCFESHTDTILSKESQKKLLKEVKKKLPEHKELCVQWFGGEPLKAYGIMEGLSKKLMELCEEASKPYSATIITNGYLMDESMCLQLPSLGVKRVQITFDGDSQLHNRIRKEKGTRGSFNRIVDNMLSLPKEIELDVRIHVAPYNRDTITNLLDELIAYKAHKRISSLYFAPLFNYKVGMEGQAYATDAKRFTTSEQFAQMQIELLTEAKKKGFNLKDWLDVSYGICTAVRESTFVVDSSGGLYKCYKDVGNDAEAFSILGSDKSNEENLSKWMEISTPRDEECQNCKVLPLCLGGCTKQWHEKASKSVICSPLKFNIEKRIKLSSSFLE